MQCTLLTLMVGFLACLTRPTCSQPALGEIYRLKGLQSDILMDTFRFIEDRMSSNHRRLGRRLNSIDSSIRGMETTFGIESPETEGEAEPDVPVFPVIPDEEPNNIGGRPGLKPDIPAPELPPIGQIARSCDEIYRMGFRNDNDYVIDPDGPGRGTAPEFNVRCELSRGQGVTIIGHNYDDEAVSVSGYEPPGSFQLQLRYNNANFEQLEALTKVSQTCEQYIKIVCLSAVLFRGQVKSEQRDYGWWIARDGTRMMSWGGVESSTDSGQCACDLDDTCVNKNFKCNCDSNNKFRTEDSGFLTDKEYLPVRMVYLGDTGGRKEQSWLTLGKFMCKGYAPE
ncbi:contactin-associated protein-like 2 [Asterias rubens]|uniref:contactin-associated protein-like 2 n=1 Tax=Asterias rubens TaxID=7604 RepID=UPI001454E893|nr:contactin-associated protein-like 2 [Asterias rubens]XP_033632080.1 contactin-associated protein-like 2 [Asterias rubens]